MTSKTSKFNEAGFTGIVTEYIDLNGGLNYRVDIQNLKTEEWDNVIFTPDSECCDSYEAFEWALDDIKGGLLLRELGCPI